MVCRFRIRIIAALLIFPCFFAAGTSDTASVSTRYTIAVSDFTVLGGINELQWIGESCAEGVISTLVAEPSIRIVERKYLKTVIDELKFQESGLVDEKNAVTLGKLTGAKYFILGSATVMEQSVLLRARLVNVETAEAVLSCEANGTVSELFRLQKEIARKIAVKLIGHSVLTATTVTSEPATLTSSVRSNIQRLKKMSSALPLFALDPARKRKTAEFTTAGILCDNIIEQYPDAVTGYYYKALFSMHAEEYPEAESAIRSALRISPDDHEVQLLRAMLLFHTEKYDATKVLLQYMATRDPRDSRIWYGTAKTAARLNDQPAAAEALIRSLLFAPYIAHSETFLESLLSQRHFSKTDFADINIWNALLLFQKIRGGEGSVGTGDLALTQTVARAFPGLYVPYFAAGLIYSSLGKQNESESAFQQCLSRAPEHPFIHRELAYLYLRSGNCEMGKQHAGLYLQTSQSIEDFQTLRNAIDRCK